MEIRGLCSICGRADKIYTCSLCGTMVCSRCFQPKQGICKRCQKGLKYNLS